MNEMNTSHAIATLQEVSTDPLSRPNLETPVLPMWANLGNPLRRTSLADSAEMALGGGARFALLWSLPSSRQV